MNERIERIWSRIQRDPSGCWIWTGRQDRQGYGSFGAPSRPAHRVLYEILVESVPKHLQLDHLCRVKLCVNPSHLEPVTALENIRRSQPFRTLATHCVHGHPLSGDNLAVKKNGTRRCRECHRREERRRAARAAGLPGGE